MRDFSIYDLFLNAEDLDELSCYRAVMMGLMLHANGKKLIRNENYKDALEVLSMGEVSGSPVFASG